MNTRTALLAFLLLAVFALEFLEAAREKSPTYDEVAYLGLGRYLLRGGSWDGTWSVNLQPPLSFYLHGLPLLARPMDDAVFDLPPGLPLRPAYAHYPPRGNALLADDPQGPQAILFAARRALLPVSLLLGLLVFGAARRLYGDQGGLLSLFLFALSPNLLAHAPLITPDACLAACGFASVAAAIRLVHRPGLGAAVAAGIALGAAVLSKHAGLLFVPLPIALILLARRRRDAAPAPGARHAIALYAAAASLFLAAYRGDPRPFLDALAFQWGHSEGHMGYAAGRFQPGGFFWFFFFALAVKVPLSKLLLFLPAALNRSAPRPGWGEAALAAPILLFLCAFTIGHQSIGLRYLLPAFPFAFVLLGRAAAGKAAWRSARGALVALLMAGYLLANLSIRPHFLAYFNEVAGGPANGPRLLADSNLDWGQDLPLLRDWLRERSIGHVYLSWFGAADPGLYLRFEEEEREVKIPFTELPGFRQSAPVPGETRLPEYPRGVFAISATNLAGVYLSNPDLFRAFRNARPSARLGWSIYVFETVPPK